LWVQLLRRWLGLGLVVSVYWLLEILDTEILMKFKEFYCNLKQRDPSIISYFLMLLGDANASPTSNRHLIIVSDTIA
jgi:hypothetical protein